MVTLTRLRCLDYVENKEREVSWELCNSCSALWSSLYLHMNQTFLRFPIYKKGILQKGRFILGILAAAVLKIQRYHNVMFFVVKCPLRVIL